MNLTFNYICKVGNEGHVETRTGCAWVNLMLTPYFGGLDAAPHKVVLLIKFY